ncbi:MAG: DinB family protein [Actinomycetota bacterium]
MAEGRDWTRSQFEACPDCGFDAAAIADRDVARALTDQAAAWGRFLATAPIADLRRWSEPNTWSALEYACHTRDVVGVFEERVRRTSVEPGQQLGWWDHEAAVTDEDYNRHEPVLVAETMAAHARRFGATLGALDDPQWDLAAEQRPGEHFTIRGMARFVLHELAHHRWDADRLVYGR